MRRTEAEWKLGSTTDVISIEHSLSLVESSVATHGSLALFVIIYFESFGAPLPGESALIAASVLAVRGDLPIAAVLAASWSGSVLGDGTGYLVGRFGGQPLLMRFGPSIGLTGERFEFVANQIRRYGIWLILVARFIVVLRQLNGLVAGAVLMPLTRFIPATAIGSALWAATWGLGPYLLGTWFGLSAVH